MRNILLLITMLLAAGNAFAGKALLDANLSAGVSVYTVPDGYQTVVVTAQPTGGTVLVEATTAIQNNASTTLWMPWTPGTADATDCATPCSDALYGQITFFRVTVVGGTAKVNVRVGN